MAVKDEPVDVRVAGEDALTPPRASLPASNSIEDDGISDSPTPPRRTSPTPQKNGTLAVTENGSEVPFQPKLKQTGVVAHFHEEKGWGFIKGEGDEQFFVHFSGIAGKGFKKLEKGQNVLFDTEWNAEKVKEQATNVKILLTASQQGRKGDNGRSRSPRVKDQMTLLGKKHACTDDGDDPLYAAVNDTLTSLFRAEQEHDVNLHKKVMQYVKQAVKRTNFEAHIVDIFKNFADAFFSSLFAAYGDRAWLRDVKVDFAWVFDIAVQELFPPELQTKWAEAELPPEKLRNLLHKAHDKMFDSARFFNILHECVKSSKIDGKKTQHKVFEACSSGRNAAIINIKKSLGIDVWKSAEEKNFSLGDLETFTKLWISATVQEAKSRSLQEGAGAEGILSRSCAGYLFDSLLRERAFPQIMLRSLEDSWPKSPWPAVAKQIQKAYGGDDSSLRRDEPYALAKVLDIRNGKAGALNPKFNAKLQRERGYGRRRQFASYVKRESPGPLDWSGPTWGHSSSSSTSAVPPPPPPPPTRQRNAAVWGTDGNGCGGSNYGVQCYGTEYPDEPIHSQTSWTGQPWQRALPSSEIASNSVPLPPARSRTSYGGRERPLLGRGIKQEEEKGNDSWQNHNVKREYSKIKARMDSDDDSEDDFRLKHRAFRGAPSPNSFLARPVGTRDWRSSSKDFGWKGKHHGKGDDYKGVGKGYVKEELGDDWDRRFDDMDAEENGVAW